MALGRPAAQAILVARLASGAMVSLHTEDPGDDGANEAPVDRQSSTWIVANGAATNASAIVFRDVPVGTYTHWGVYIGGQWFGGGALAEPIVLSARRTIELAAGALRIQAKGAPNDPETAVLILPETHRLWWSPGIPGGIPTGGTVYTTLDASDFGNGALDASSAVQDALAAASAVATRENPAIVQLSAGEWRIDSSILFTYSNVILRGAGVRETIINGGQIPFYIGTRWYSYASHPAVAVIGSPRRGDRSIEVEDASGFNVGDILMLDQIDDNGGDPYGTMGGYVWRDGLSFTMRGPYSDGARDGEGPDSPGGYRSVRQMIEIAAIDGNTLHLANRVNMDFDEAMQPQVWNTAATMTQFAGVEGFTIRGHSDQALLFTKTSSYCWAKNVEIDGSVSPTGINHIFLDGFRHIIHGCYLHHAPTYYPGGGSYGLLLIGGDCLIENNVFYAMNKVFLGRTTCGGNVIAYNYADECVYAELDGEWQETGFDTSHGCFSHSDLYEGNLAPNLSTDVVWGNAGWMTFFRNYATGQNTSGHTTANLCAVNVEGWQREHASIGNVWGSPTFGPDALFDTPDNRNGGRVIYRLGNGGGGLNGVSHGFGNYDDGTAASAFHRHLDWDAFTQSQYDNPDNPVKVLPPSLYLSTKPAWWPSGYAWPWVDPAGATHEERVKVLPAKAWFDALEE